MSPGKHLVQPGSGSRAPGTSQWPPSLHVLTHSLCPIVLYVLTHIFPLWGKAGYRRTTVAPLGVPAWPQPLTRPGLAPAGCAWGSAALLLPPQSLGRSEVGSGGESGVTSLPSGRSLAGPQLHPRALRGASLWLWVPAA